MVQYETVMRLSKEWAERGNPPCSHPDIETEYYLGSSTGDVACTTCGEDWPKSRRPR